MANQFNPWTLPTDFDVFPSYFRALRARPAVPHGFEPVGPLPPPTAATPPAADPPPTAARGAPDERVVFFGQKSPAYAPNPPPPSDYKPTGVAPPPYYATRAQMDGPTYAQTEELLTLLHELVAAVNRIGR